MVYMGIRRTITWLKAQNIPRSFITADTIGGSYARQEDGCAMHAAPRTALPRTADFAADRDQGRTRGVPVVKQIEEGTDICSWQLG
jgi:hypothetical protein